MRDLAERSLMWPQKFSQRMAILSPWPMGLRGTGEGNCRSLAVQQFSRRGYNMGLYRRDGQNMARHIKRWQALAGSCLMFDDV